MNLHEYQSKELFRAYGIPVPNGKIAFSAHEAVDAAKLLEGDKVVVKFDCRKSCGAFGKWAGEDAATGANFEHCVA